MDKGASPTLRALSLSLSRAASVMMAMSQCHKTVLSRALVGHLREWSPKRRACCAANDGGQQQKHAASHSSAKDLKVAPGIDKDDSKEKQQKLFWSLLVGKVQEVADYVTEVTESDTYQLRSLQFAISLFPIWLLYLLVAAGAIQLPFRLPFIDN